VYGTLKKGYGNNVLLEDAKFIEERIISGYKLYYSFKEGGFPVAAPDENSAVTGELYELPSDNGRTLSYLDRLEGEGRMYNRVEVESDIFMYVGHPRSWSFKDMTECPHTNGFYEWNR
jgi:gamma-glutamylcyclotransferase (GGCT)/AIG2-like uncharacterized protein YtfP